MKLKFINKILSISLLLLFTLSTSCTQKAEYERKTNKFNEGSKIIIGAAAPWNELEKEKIFLKEGIMLAVEKINNKGGVNGKRIEVVWKDDLGTVRQGKIVAEDLADNTNAIAVIGHYNSAVSVAASVIYEHSGVLMITPSSTTPKLTSRIGNKLTFRNTPSDDSFAKSLAYYIANTGFGDKVFINSILIYNEDSLYGSDLAEAFEKYIVSHRITVTARRLFDSKSERLFFKEDLENINKLYKFDAIFISGLGEKTSILIEEIRKLGMNMPIFCGEGITGHELIEMIGIDANGTVYCSTYNPTINTPAVKCFKEEFLKQFKNEPDSSAVQGYDTMMILASAIEKAKSTVPDDIAKALRTINYSGLTGNIAFNEKGELADPKVVIEAIDKDKVVIIDSASYEINNHYENN